MDGGIGGCRIGRVYGADGTIRTIHKLGAKNRMLQLNI